MALFRAEMTRNDRKQNCPKTKNSTSFNLYRQILKKYSNRTEHVFRKIQSKALQHFLNISAHWIFPRIRIRLRSQKFAGEG